MYQKILEAFKKHQLRYLIIGGYAATFYGVIRSTFDLDLCVDRKKAVDALRTSHLIKLPFENDMTQFLNTPYFLLTLFILTSAFTAPAQPFTNLSPSEFQAHVQQHPDAIILDTRMIVKYERNRIPGAQPAPHTEALKVLTDTLSKDHRLLVYCGHNERSTYVCRMLTKEMGFVNVFRLKGGLIRWEKENLPLDTVAVRTGLE